VDAETEFGCPDDVGELRAVVDLGGIGDAKDEDRQGIGMALGFVLRKASLELAVKVLPPECHGLTAQSDSYAVIGKRLAGHDPDERVLFSGGIEHEIDKSHEPLDGEWLIRRDGGELSCLGNVPERI
jgi:hypothetical protein